MKYILTLICTCFFIVGCGSSGKTIMTDQEYIDSDGLESYYRMMYRSEQFSKLEYQKDADEINRRLQILYDVRDGKKVVSREENVPPDVMKGLGIKYGYKEEKKDR